MAPCLPVYLSHPGPFRPFLPVLLNWFFCLHPFLFHTLVPQHLSSHLPPRLLLYADDPQTWFHQILNCESLKQNWRMPWREHWLSLLKQKPPPSLPTPHRGRDWCAASNLEDLESKARAESLAYIWRGENGICLGADSSLAIFLCSPHPQLFGCGSSLAHSPGLCSGSSSFHRCHSNLLAPSMACQVGLLTTAARVIPSKINI